MTTLANDWDLSPNSMDSNMDAYCPCRRPFRWLQDEEDDTIDEDEDVLLWEILYTCGVFLFMFVALLSDRVGADSVMMVALTAFMASGIISVAEGLTGFANEGLLTVLSLFVVAEGISKTGALDWYMGKLLGRPNTTPSAQLRLMVPIAIVSAFLNNTPVVAVMIPIVQKWAKNIRISAQQLLIPLSFASILGGTCTLIGTSTNLVVVGLLKERYPDDPATDIGLFDLGLYGVPIAMAGICYILLASPCWLPGGTYSSGGQNNNGAAVLPMDHQEDILLGARLTPWSPAAGRSVKRSGLRDTGGIYLVSVHRAATGNVHRAVGQDFVLNVGDILYFTGLIEGFGEFCEDHGMEVLTNELQETNDDHHNNNDNIGRDVLPETSEVEPPQLETNTAMLNESNSKNMLLTVVEEGEEEVNEEVPCEVGVTKESLIQADEAERSRSITRMIGKKKNKMMRAVEEKKRVVLLHPDEVYGSHIMICMCSLSFLNATTTTTPRFDSRPGSGRTYRGRNVERLSSSPTPKSPQQRFGRSSQGGRHIGP
jgi:di/tricarboxylate transporter